MRPAGGPASSATIWIGYMDPQYGSRAPTLFVAEGATGILPEPGNAIDDRCLPKGRRGVDGPRAGSADLDAAEIDPAAFYRSGLLSGAIKDPDLAATVSSACIGGSPTTAARALIG